MLSATIPMLFVLALLALSIPLVPVASAHPFIEDTIPNTSQSAPVGTNEVAVFFSESVDIEFSEIAVLDDTGNRIDHKDLRYYQDELSLIVSTPPLQDGVYTVSTKVLSKVDGHLVPGVFLFGVGDAIVDTEISTPKTELILLPESGADFLGIIGQTIIVGTAVIALTVWGAQERYHIKDRLTGAGAAHHKRFMQLTGASLLLVLGSNILVIILQMTRLESGLVEVTQTQFGSIWMTKMAITMALFGIWFVANRRRGTRNRERTLQVLMLAAALALMMTSSVSGHGAATNTMGPVVLDYIHNVVAGIWIGGTIYILFVILPALSGYQEPHRGKISLAMIPRFSMIFIISVGVVIVTGPTLLWTLESDIGLITESLYGKLIILKIALASAMVGLGMHIQYKIQRKAVADLVTNSRSELMSVHTRLKNALKADAVLGIALLAVVALLINGTLPAGEVYSVDAEEISSGLSVTEFSDNLRFDMDITPFSTGDNLIVISVTSINGTTIDDLDRIKVKTSNPERGIPPIEVDMEALHNMDTAYQGESTLAFSGQWLIEVEALRTQNANEAISLDVFAKPRLASIDTTITEYALPNGSLPLHAAYDDAGSMWFTDSAAPRLWEVDTETGTITVHEFEGNGTTALTYNSHDGNIWFIDNDGGQIGFVDIRTDRITTAKVPEFASQQTDLVDEKAILFFVEADRTGDIWLTIINKGLIIRYQPESGVFEKIVVPGADARPFALTEGPDGMIWYTDTKTGTVGYVDPSDNSLTEIIGQNATLQAPEALLFEKGGGGGLWIAEHTGLAITRFDPVLETLERHTVDEPDALPFGMALDRYGNIWFAEHVVDKIGVLDPRSGEIVEVDIPTKTSFVQFLESDSDGNIWFAEQRASKVGVLTIREKPTTNEYQMSDSKENYNLHDIRYTDLVSPLMALGVLGVALFYVKTVNNKRRLDNLLMANSVGHQLL